MGATIARKSLQMFCKAIMELYGEDFLQKLTYKDIEKLYAYHDENHGFPGMLGSIDCTYGAIASQDLWVWHAFFGVLGMNKDVNVLRQSPIFNDLKSRRAPDVPFMANDVPYKKRYYLTNGIYSRWAILIKSIKNPEEQHRDDDPVRTHKQSMQFTQEIIGRADHLSLESDLVKHIWNNAN
nr:protein ALP1-like [Tanacetum cinerariifolium]